jgi:hypothetical protein
MARYGLNPYGEPEFRIVFAPSVKTLVGGQFADGYAGYRARPAYRHIGPKWIVEKWLSAERHTGMNAVEYELRFRDPPTGLLLTGPYPARGCYAWCHTFAACDPVNENLDLLIALLKKAERNDPRENQRAMLDSMEREERAEDARRFDQCKELLPAFGIRAANLGGRVKATKSAPTMKSANELGLPIPTGGDGARRPGMDFSVGNAPRQEIEVVGA